MRRFTSLIPNVRLVTNNELEIVSCILNYSGLTSESMFIPLHQNIDLTCQHGSKMKLFHLAFKDGQFVIETRIEVVMQCFSVWE